MPEPKRTMMLSPYEWRSLVIASATNLYQFANTVTAAETPPSVEQVQWLNDTLNRLQMHVSAWSASGQPVPQVQTRTLSEEEIQEAVHYAANGSGEIIPVARPKKKRGWQKGRKRGLRKPKGSEAVQ